jgi:hypothetical protein
MIHLAATGTYSVDFNAIKFFGDYASATLWHGEDSANNANTVTINGSNGCNAVASEFEKTGTPQGVVVVSNPVTLTLTGLKVNSEVRIYQHNTTTEIDGVEDSGTSFAFSYDYQDNYFVDIVVHNLGYLYWRLDNYQLAATSAPLPVSQQIDRQYTNP